MVWEPSRKHDSMTFTHYIILALPETLASWKPTENTWIVIIASARELWGEGEWGSKIYVLCNIDVESDPGTIIIIVIIVNVVFIIFIILISSRTRHVYRIVIFHECNNCHFLFTRQRCSHEWLINVCWLIILLIYIYFSK